VDRAAFHRFFDATAATLKAYLRLKSGSAALADDLVQETYLRLLRRHLPELNAAQLKAYLYKTAHSVCADHFRAHRQEARWRRGGARVTDAELGDGADASERQGESTFDALALPVDMQRVLDTLKPRQRSLLWLAYVEGFNHDEIAEVMGLRVASVKVLLSRARAQLAAKLEERGLAPSQRVGRK
jgi:RNA polymerase sigma-70 factor (ECF subfamily)